MNDQMADNLDEAFAKLLSIWANYFDDDPMKFFAASRPLVNEFISRYDEAENALMPNSSSNNEIPSVALLKPDVIDAVNGNLSFQENISDQVPSNDMFETESVLRANDGISNSSILLVTRTETLNLQESEADVTPICSLDVNQNANIECGDVDSCLSMVNERLLSENGAGTSSDANDKHDDHHILTPEIEAISNGTESKFSCDGSRKRRFIATETIIPEPVVKRVRFSDFLLAPINPALSLFGTSAPSRTDSIAVIPTDGVASSKTNEAGMVELSADNSVTNTRELNDIDVVQKTCLCEGKESNTAVHDDTHLTTDSLSRETLSIEEPMELDEENGNLTNPNSTPSNIKLNEIQDTDVNEALSTSTDQHIQTLHASDDVMEVPPIMPAYFPSLFGRSVKKEVSPLESPEKFVGVYKTLYKDLLAASQERSDHVEGVAASSVVEPSGRITTSSHIISESHSELPNDNDTFMSNVEDALEINDVVFNILNEVSSQFEIGPNATVLSQEPPHGMATQEAIFPEVEINVRTSLDNLLQEVEQVHPDNCNTIGHGNEMGFNDVDNTSPDVLNSDEKYIVLPEIVNVNDSTASYHLNLSEINCEAPVANIDNSDNNATNIIVEFPEDSTSLLSFSPCDGATEQAGLHVSEVDAEIVNEDTDSFHMDTNGGHGDAENVFLGKKSSSYRSPYMVPLKTPDTYLVAGRNDGASEHFIPILQQSQKAANGDIGVKEPILPYALRETNDIEPTDDSKAAFNEAVKNFAPNNQRVSMNDMVARHSQTVNEIIVLDDVVDDDFDRRAQEIILDTDANSSDPCPVIVHPSLTKLLKKHQTEGIRFLYKCLIGSIENLGKNGPNLHTGAILAHCMGLGKTFSVIAFLQTILNHPKIKLHIRRVLILAPPGLIPNWCAEFRKWLVENDPILDVLKVYEVSTTQKDWNQRRQILKEWIKGDRKVVIMGYEMFRNSFKSLSPHLLTSPGPDIVVCDEAHVLNSSSTQLFEAVKKISTLKRISLTGTPIQNKLDEYYHMVNFVAPGMLPSLRDFQKLFINPIDAATTKEASASDAEIMKKKAVVLWKQLEMVMNRQNFSILSKILPEKKEYVIFLRLSPPQLELYGRYMELQGDRNMLAQQKAFAQEHTLYRIGAYPYLVKMCEKSEKKNDAKGKDSRSLGDWYSGILKKHGCTADAFHTGNKLLFVLELLKWFEKLGEKTIIFTHYVEVVDVLIRMLEAKSKKWFSDRPNFSNECKNWGWQRDTDYYLIQGSTPAAKRYNMIQKFNDPLNKRGRLFFCTDAGSIGTNMTGGTRVILFEAKHNPAKEVQAIFRSYRIGQNKPVHVYRLISQGTMEDCIFKRQIVKQQITARVLDNEGASRTIQRTDIDELLRFHPSPENVNFTTQPDYHPTGDNEFDDFCLSHRNIIVEIKDHDSMIAFNEDEKLSVEAGETEWQDHLRKSCSLPLQDEVFKNIQEEEASVSVQSIDDGENQEANSTQNVHVTSSFPTLQNTNAGLPFLQKSDTPRPLLKPSLFRSQFVRPSQGISLAHNVTPLPRPRMPSLSSVTALRPGTMPFQPRANINAVRSSHSVLHPTLASSAKKAPKRRVSPDVITLEDENDEDAPNRPKSMKFGPKESNSSRKP